LQKELAAAPPDTSINQSVVLHYGRKLPLLHHAARFGHIAILQFLLRQPSIDVIVRAAGGIATALWHAVTQVTGRTSEFCRCSSLPVRDYQFCLILSHMVVYGRRAIKLLL
jgi:hypothetical protein